MAVVRSNVSASTSETSCESALPASFSVPWNVRVAWRGFPVTGSRPVNARSSQ